MNSHIKSLPIEKKTHSSIWLASDTLPLIDTDHCARGLRVWLTFSYLNSLYEELRHIEHC